MGRLLGVFVGFAMAVPFALMPGLGSAAPTAPRAAAPRAAAISAADAKQIRLLIESQLKAFEADDAVKAFSYAAPELREMFGDPERFLDMVRTAYPVVYRPATVTFMKPARADGDLTQPVRMTDGAGALWLAVYHLQRQRDKTWRISGCEVVQAGGKMI